MCGYVAVYNFKLFGPDCHTHLSIGSIFESLASSLSAIGKAWIGNVHRSFSSYLGRKKVESAQQHLPIVSFALGSGGVHSGWRLAGGSEVRAAENELRWSLAEYLFLQRNNRANTVGVDYNRSSTHSITI